MKNKDKRKKVGIKRTARKKNSKWIVYGHHECYKCRTKYTLWTDNKYNDLVNIKEIILKKKK
jgi:hypothetical protein